MVVLACLGLLGVLAIGSLWYIAHRVKNAVIEKAQENGVDLRSIVPPDKTSHNRHKTHKPCDLLSKEEASSLLGEPIVRSEFRDAACVYNGPAGLAAQLAQENAAKTFKQLQTPSSKIGGMEVASAVEQLAGSMGAGQDGNGGEMPMLMLAVDDDGKPQMTALNASNAIFSGIFNAADPEHKAQGLTSAQIKGLGDQAVRIPKLGLNVLQGETIVRVIPGPIPDADAKTIDIARVVLKKL